uniref:Uncharacterized protein TCIL3000_10_1650 n=1 Tax=Trypanosoma congolense (strain IL3000) TaxID=1068625 RepID=G0UVJ0_TRYCI|nr:unnamed protein product [Trypanosoma congolense IL3000]
MAERCHCWTPCSITFTLSLSSSPCGMHMWLCFKKCSNCERGALLSVVKCWMPVLREIVIGTDECVCCDGPGDVSGQQGATAALGGSGVEYRDNEIPLPQRPSLVEVEVHVEGIRRLLDNGGLPLEPTDIEPIHEIVDKLDQVFFWAVEEGNSFAREPSLLAQCEVPHLLLRCITTRRPKIVTAALSVMRHLLRNEQACSHILAWIGRTSVSDDKHNPLLEGDGLCGLIAGVMRRFLGLAELQVEAIALAAVAARFNIDQFLESAVIGHVLAALQRHSGNSAVQKEGVRLFSVLVDIERNEAGENVSMEPCESVVVGEGNVAAAPTAVIFSQIGVVVSFVLQSAATHINNAEVKRDAVHFFNRCASYPVNIASLLASGIYPLLIRMLSFSLLLPDVFAEIMETIAALVPLLDPLQCRSLALAVRRILLTTDSPYHISICAALILRLLKVKSACSTPLDAMSFDDCDVVVPAVRTKELAFSDLIALRDDNLLTFLTEISLPQLLCHAADNFSEDLALRRLVGDVTRLLVPTLR